jgi:hypothetical protein
VLTKARHLAVGGFLLLCNMARADATVASPHDKALIKKAGSVPARLLLAPKQPIAKPEVPLKGTIRQYVSAVVHTNGAGRVTRAAVVPCAHHDGGACVEIVGDACPPEVYKSPESECEGMSLTVVVDVTSAPRLDSAVDGGRNPVHDQVDVEKALQEAP